MSSGKITDAVVYLNGAQITRNQKFKTVKGVNKLIFDNLPSGIENNSITASSDGSSAVLSVTHNVVYAKAPGKRITELTEELECLKDEIQSMIAMTAVLNGEEALIGTNSQITSGKMFRSEDVKDLVIFFRERMSSISSERISIQKKIEKISERTYEIESEIGISDASRQRSRIEIEVHSEKDAEANIAISYFTYNARWDAYYDIRASDVQSPVSVLSKAMIYQNTGEDWDNVNLVLSTGNPSLGGNVPELHPWYLRFYEPAVKRKAMFNTLVKSEEVTEAPVDGLMYLEEKVNAVPSVVSENITSIEYSLKMPYTILSSENGKSVDIDSHGLKAEYVYRSVRKLEKDVFLVAEIKEWERLNLLAGKANIFFEDKYVGESFIDPRKADGNLQISLGRDKNVVVTRVKGKDYTSKSAIGSTIKTSMEWELTARNLKKQSINIVLEDQVPVSTDKSIIVEAVNISGAEFNRDTGKLEWKFSLEPAGSKSFQIKYSVSYPKSKVVVLD